MYDHLIYPISTSSAFFKTASQLTSTQPLSGLSATRLISKSKYKELHSAILNAVVALAVETATAGYGALVFCSGRQSCQNIAVLISKAMPSETLHRDTVDKRGDILNELRSLSVGLDETMAKTILRGVAFHRRCS